MRDWVGLEGWAVESWGGGCEEVGLEWFGGITGGG